MKKYDLWWYDYDLKEWGIISSSLSMSYRRAVKALERQTSYTLEETSMRASLFKIAEHGDTSWMQHVPEYLLRKDGKNEKI